MIGLDTDVRVGAQAAQLAALGRAVQPELVTVAREVEGHDVRAPVVDQAEADHQGVVEDAMQLV